MGEWKALRTRGEMRLWRRKKKEGGKGMSELFSNILLSHLKLKKNVRSLLINNT